MTDRVNICDAKLHLSALLDRAAEGEEIIICKHGKPVARLMPLATARKRFPAHALGVSFIADDFDDDLPQAVLTAFQNSR